MAQKNALIRKRLQELAQGGASPSSLLQDGDAILSKADKISGFLSKQKSRTNASTGKSDWLIVYQHLQDEREAAERELAATLTSMAEGGTAGVAVTSSTTGSVNLSAHATDCLAAARASADECRQLRGELRRQLLDISKVHAGLKAYARRHGSGPGAPDALAKETELLRSQVACLREDVTLQLRTLGEEHDALLAQIGPQAAALCSTSAGSAAASPVKGGGGSGRGGASDSSPGRPSSSTSLSCLARNGSGAPSSSNSISAAGRETAELEDLISRYALTSAGVKGSIREVHHALALRVIERQEAWRADADAVGAGAGLPGATGGWGADEHSQFVRLRERYYTEGGKGGGTSREAALSRAAALLPGRDTAAVLRHDDWYVAHMLLSRRRRDAAEAWGREHRTFLGDSELFLDESACAAAAAAEHAVQVLEHELRREAVNDTLTAMREAKQAEWDAGAGARAAAAAAAAEMQALEEELSQAEACVRRERLAAYRLALEKQARRKAEAEADAEAQERDVRAAALAAARPHVELRAAMHQMKVKAAANAEAERVAEADARAARLEALRALVAPDVVADPERTRAPTASWLSRPNEEEECARGAAAPFQKVNGYTTKQVYADPRFKLMDALSRQGLHTTAAARAAIGAAATVRAPRLDNLTHVQRAAAGMMQ
ncbi:hypothetical protein FOA52_011834 [Chlamydomonas sp. UWO 241]|nr:hypothetical protein FOA52_011834 [Chlamydomonas sp. UWO 241]